MTDPGAPGGCGLMSLNCNKAGMGGLDRERINQIIEAASKGSKFYKKKQEDQKRIDGQTHAASCALLQLTGYTTTLPQTSLRFIAICL